VHEEPSVRLRFTPDQLQEAYDRLVTQRRETESYVLEVQDAAHLRPESLLHTDGAYDDVTDPVMLRRPAPEEAARAIETQLYTRSGLALLCIRPSPGLRCHIPASGLSVGRSHRNDLVLPDVELSDFHAMVIWEAGQWWIRCSRGESLKVNGEQQREAELVPGAQLELGDACFLVMADRSDPPGMMLDYPALLEELVERFPDILQEGTFRLNAGLRVEERVLLLPPRRRWNEVLNALRGQADVRPLRRLISALEQLQPEARMVQRARRCLDGLAGLEARAVS
jgi:hypothetical protein